MYLYDTKIDFLIDEVYKHEGVYGGKWLEARESGSWLGYAYLKQRSDEFQVFQFFHPEAKKGKSYERAAAEGGGSEGRIDFTSYAEVSRSGSYPDYTYTVCVKFMMLTHMQWLQPFLKQQRTLAK